ncbi:MAG: transcription antitermination factor NusB, partial [Alphaproteobacteria bacterium]|nr:transcription antitermination factor NusB [Alphaproteobacteria bacterium]
MGQENAKTDYAMRRLARLAAVQGLYQIALSPEPADVLIQRFKDNPAVLLQEERSVIAVDTELFGKIVSGASTHQTDLDTLIAGALDERLSANRLEQLLKAILRAGVFELLHNADIAENI